MEHNTSRQTNSIRPLVAALIAGVLITGCGSDARPIAGPPAPQAAPTITSISPEEGLSGLSTRVAIRGTGFQGGVVVTLGGPAAVMAVSGGTVISALTPNHQPDVVDVTVTNPDGQSATLKNAYSYRTVTLTTSAATVTPGQEVNVSWVAPGRGDPDLDGDWVGLFKTGTSDTTHLWGQYTTGASGTLVLKAPDTPGEYEVRYYAGDDHVAPSVVMARTTLLVKEP